MISWENYEEYMIMHADGELQPAEEQELMDFLNEYPQLKNELSAYQVTRLSPDETLLYPHKNALLKEVPVKRVVVFPAWAKYGVAAGIAALIFFSVLKFRNGNSNINTIVKSDKSQSLSPASTGNLPEKSSATSSVPANSIRQSITAASAPGYHKQLNKIKEKIVSKNQETEIPSTVTATKEITYINALPVVSTRELVSNTTVVTISLMSVPELSEPIAGEEERRSFWDWLPMEDEKKERLHNIAGAVASVYSGSSKADNVPGDKKVDVKIENRKLKVSF